MFIPQERVLLEEAIVTDQSRDTHDDDTSGHKFHSPRTVKENVEPVSHDDDTDDTSGHRSYSDRTVKENVEPVSHDEDDDTAGHGRWNP
jgi:hypothetical protein